jgi:hypothetical protein
MMRRLRRCSPVLRALWVALLLLAVVVKPALVAASEVHESEHLLQTGHTLDSQHEEHGIPHDEPMSGDTDSWHALMHLGHCCSHPPALLLSALAVDLSPVVTSPVAFVPLAKVSATLTQPLRPPIRG